jgi:hypothetical protein
MKWEHRELNTSNCHKYPAGQYVQSRPSANTFNFSPQSHSGDGSNLACASPPRYFGPEKQSLVTTPDRFTWYNLPTFMSRAYPNSGLRCCSNEWFSALDNAPLTSFWYVSSFKCTIIEHSEQSKEIIGPIQGSYTFATGRIKNRTKDAFAEH